MKLAPITSPSTPRERIVTKTATTNATGCTKCRGIPNTSRPQSRVDASEYSPIEAAASVCGKRISAYGGGDAISGSSTPCQRWKLIAPPEPNSVDVQIPISPADNAPYRSVPG